MDTEPYMHVLLSERSQSEKVTFCVVPTGGPLEKAHCRDSEKTCGCQESGKRKAGTGGAQSIYRAVEGLCGRYLV